MAKLGMENRMIPHPQARTIMAEAAPTLLVICQQSKIQVVQRLRTQAQACQADRSAKLIAASHLAKEETLTQPEVSIEASKTADTQLAMLQQSIVVCQIVATSPSLRPLKAVQTQEIASLFVPVIRSPMLV